MTVQQIINLALSNTHTKSGQISTDNLIMFFNIARHEMANALIKDVDENYFFQIWTIDAEDTTVASRANGEYLYPVGSSSQAGMSKLLRLAIKGFSTDTYYTPAKEVDIRNLGADWNYILNNQPKAEPVYFLADESIFIAPLFNTADLPTPQAGNKQIKLYGIAKLADLTADALEAAVLIPSDFHPAIAVGMEHHIHKSRGKRNEATASYNEFETIKEKMIDSLTNRDNSPMIAQVPDDTELGYGN